MRRLYVFIACLFAVSSSWATWFDVGWTNADFDQCTQDVYAGKDGNGGGFDNANYDVPGWMDYGTPVDSGEQATGAWWSPYSGHSAFMDSGDAAFILSPYVIKSGDLFNLSFLAKGWATYANTAGAKWTVTLFYGSDPSTNVIATYDTGVLTQGDNTATWANYGTNISATAASVGHTLGLLFQSTGPATSYANLDNVSLTRFVDTPFAFGTTYPAANSTDAAGNVFLSCDVFDSSSTFASANFYLDSFTNAPISGTTVVNGTTNTVTADSSVTFEPLSTHTAYLIATGTLGEVQTNSWTFTAAGQFGITVSPDGYALAYDYQPTVSAQIIDLNDTLDYAQLFINGVDTGVIGVGGSATTTVSYTTATLQPGTNLTAMVIAHSAAARPDVTNSWSFTMGGDTGITIWNTNTPPVGINDVSQTNSPGQDSENISTDDAWTYVAGNRQAQGQFFTTPAGSYGYVLDSVWVRHTPYDAGGTGLGVGDTVTLRITDPALTNTASFVKHSETLTVINDSLVTGDGRWIQLKLASPVVLNSSKMYGFDLGASGPYFDTCGINLDKYAAGTAYISGPVDVNGYGTGAGDNSATLAVNSNDRTFIVSLAESGAPFNVDLFSPTGSGINNSVTLQVDFTELGGTYDEANTKLYLDGVQQSFTTGGSSPNYILDAPVGELAPLTTHTGMVVLASSSPVVTVTNYTYFTMADAFGFTGYEPAEGTSLLTNATPLSVQVINQADFISSVAVTLDGSPLGTTSVASGSTTTVSVASSGPLGYGVHTASVIASGIYGNETNSWTFSVHESTSDKLWNINIKGDVGYGVDVTDGTIAVAPGSLSGTNMWNNVQGVNNSNNTATNSFSCFDDNGTNSIGFTTYGSQFYGWTDASVVNVAQQMFQGWVGANAPMNMTGVISNLDTTASYDIYLYSTWRWTQNTVTYDIVQGFGTDTGVKTCTENRANVAGAAANDYSGCVEGENYVVYRGVTPNTNGVIAFTGQCNDGILAGLQIREHPGTGYVPAAEVVSMTPTGVVASNETQLVGTIVDLFGSVDTNNVQVMLDGTNDISASALVDKVGTTTTVTYATGVLPGGQHSWGIVPVTGAGTNLSTFTLSYERSVPTTLLHHWAFDDGSGTSVADSVGGANGSIIGTNYAWVVGDPIYGGALELLGGGASSDWNNTTNSAAGSYVDLPNGIMSSLTSAATIEAIYISDNTENKSWERVYSFGASNGGEGISDSGAGQIFLTPSNGGVQRSDYSGGSTIDSTPATLGKIYDVVVVIDPNNYIAKCYVNGVLVGTVNNTIAPLSDLNDINNWFGRSQWPDSMFHGALLDVKIYSGIMTASEAAAAYDAVSPTTPQGSIPSVSLMSVSNSPSLVWPTSVDTWSVQTNGDLVNGQWGDAGLTPFVDGADNVITNIVGNQTNLFYKLMYERP